MHLPQAPFSALHVEALPAPSSFWVYGMIFIDCSDVLQTVLFQIRVKSLKSKTLGAKCLSKKIIDHTPVKYFSD